MVTVRVFLTCGTPTNRAGGRFDTFIALPMEAFRRGAHIHIAMRRAHIIGYPAPYAVTEVRRLDVPCASVAMKRGSGEARTREPRRNR